MTTTTPIPSPDLQSEPVQDAAENTQPAFSNFLKLLIGLGLGILIMLMPLGQFQPQPLNALQTIAVQLDGRKKPLDTVARETVSKIHGRASYKQPNGEKLSYLPTYLAMWFNDRDWNQEPFILFSYRPLKEKLGLDPERKYFSFRELMTSDLAAIALEAEQKQSAKIDLSRDEREALTIEDRLLFMLRTVGSGTLPIVPHPDDAKGKWVGVNAAIDYYEPELAAPAIADYELLKHAYQADSSQLVPIGQLAAVLRETLINLSPNVYPDLAVMQREVNFNGLHPFAKAWQLYALAFVVMILTVNLKKLENLGAYWGAIGLFMAGLGIQGYGFIERMQIAGRPPVTNMYESVIWVGFGIAAIALAFELNTRARYYLLAAAPLSVLCLVMADSLPAVLDASINPLVPVLRDNFWLSIHVPTITLSYASFALAMGLGHILLANYAFMPQAKNRISSLSKLNYRVLQVGVLLLTTGVILGGIWAHFSWGRFWGWDPKETWALIALLCYLAPLHGRLVGWLSDFGMAITSVVSFNAVLMAWYGVNFVLGTGLHSYGFSTGGSELLVAGVVGIDLLLVLLATARYRNWFGLGAIA
ncbi:cytochrome c assembly protein [Thalassoporum mexicanum PCC 7367]|uniref:cytochrome c biogenesis protein n=1 Tax=Thalassoporum mexicanum TaxID=3457544 RepID=UPI00029FBD92|nr:cytochrome c biogenesis protein CcsA [Pseudanabaena sp. PCC 7367]AFY70926.1 cytochrome c assembly protein [Pseudanabaena sp. PCC 7367]